MEKNIAIYQDQRIAEEFCNFKCEYCEGFYPTDYSLVKDKEGNLHVPPEWHDKVKHHPETVRECFCGRSRMEDFYQMADKIIEKTQDTMDTCVLKISGGEVTIYKGLCDFVDKLHDRYPMIQILSNGSNISSEDMERYKKMKNVSFQISLDGVTPESNYGKSHSRVMTQRVVNTVDSLLENGIGVEINCVLTKYNTAQFSEFLEHYKDKDHIMIVPRPVRGEPRSILDATPEQIQIFELYIRDHYEEYAHIIPPMCYFERLFEQLKTGKRKDKCYIPYFVQSIDGYGTFEMCPIGLDYEESYNIFHPKFDKKKILLNSCYNVDNNHTNCEYCMNQYEMFNLYVEGLISLEDLRRMPSLDHDQVLSEIEKIKKKIKK